MYWMVWKNANGTPATNLVQFRTVVTLTPGQLGGTTVNRFGWHRATTVNSGSTFSSISQGSSIRIGYADGTYDGIPVSNAAAAGVGDGVYSTRESGVKFSSPSNGVLKVAGLAMFVAFFSGTPSNAFRFGLWTGSTPSNLAYTQTVPKTALSAQQWIYAYFSSTQTLQPGTVTRVTLATTGSDTSSNRYNNQEITVDTDSNSTSLLPWEGTCVKTYFDGSSWTDTAGSIFGHALLLDPAGEFGAGAGGGGVMGSRIFTGY
jgi:hypothetical protein